MKKLLLVVMVSALYCGTAAAASAPTNIVGALLGDSGPVYGLLHSLQDQSLQPLSDSLVSTSGLIEGLIAPNLGDTLDGLLVNNDLGQTINGLVGAVFLTGESAGGGLLQGQGLQQIIGQGGLIDLSYGTGKLIGLDALHLPGL